MAAYLPVADAAISGISPNQKIRLKLPKLTLILNEVQATDRVLLLDDYKSIFDGDGVWTMEILSATPFGIDRLAHVTSEIYRTLELQGTFTTME